MTEIIILTYNYARITGIVEPIWSQSTPRILYSLVLNDYKSEIILSGHPTLRRVAEDVTDIKKCMVSLNLIWMNGIKTIYFMFGSRYDYLLIALLLYCHCHDWSTPDY